MKKPALPDPSNRGFPEAIRTWLQIMCGRRENRIEPPAFRPLTFSASPTKAECEALLTYTNDVNRALRALIERLDE
jgi:hypothetical protein